VDIREIRQLHNINQANASSSVFIVDNRVSALELYHHSRNPIYRGKKKYQLLKKVMEELPGDQVACLDLRGFSDKEYRAFAEALEMLKGAANLKLRVILIRRQNNSTGVRDIMFSPNKAIELLSEKEPLVEKVTKGKFKGMYRATIDFVVREGGKIIQFSLHVFSLFRDILVEFLEMIREKRSLPGRSESLMEDIIKSEKEIQKTRGEKSGIRILIEFFKQVFGIDIGFLNPLYMENQGNPTVISHWSFVIG
jgi:hypothetical protein